jgi:ABC-2 type transport system ATP-binding protein
VQADEHARRLIMPVSGGAGVLTEALRRLDGAGVKVLDVSLRRPTLDDVFLSLTGHGAEEDDGQTDGGASAAPTTRAGEARAEKEHSR